MIRHHLPDEEPDVDELEQDWALYREMVRGTCHRCGHDDHFSTDCPIVTPVLLHIEL